MTRGLLLAGLLLFLAGTVVALALPGRESTPLLALTMTCLVGAVICFAAVAYRLIFRVDWDRIQAEQRLWESGPLGRLWLRLRSSLQRKR